MNTLVIKGGKYAHFFSSYSFLCVLLGVTVFDVETGSTQDHLYKWPSVEQVVHQSMDRNTVVAQSGEVKWTLLDTEQYLKRYRAWLHWETSAPQPLSTLNDLGALRKIIITALEREVIVQFAKSSSNIKVSNQMLRDWLRELIPGAIRPTVSGLSDFIRGRLKMRLQDDLTFFWKAVEDAYWVQIFKAQLVEQLKVEDAEKEWRRQGMLMSVWLLQIPRVPTSDEITRAIKTLEAELKTYYENHLELFSQPLRLLVEPFWIRGGRSEIQRSQAVVVRKALIEGQPLEKLKDEYPQLTISSIKTLRGRSIPQNTEIKEGAYTPTRLTRYGWTFYKIKRVYPKYVRSLNERSVKREVAAAVLREKDHLPRAMKLAQYAKSLLEKNMEDSQLKSWARSNRVRISKPDPFFESLQNVVPTIGLAPQLHRRILGLEPNQVSEPITVRQHYVVAKMLKRTQRKEDWTLVQKQFVESWKLRRSPQILDEWLTSYLKEKSRWVNTKLLQHFRSDMLRFESPIEAIETQERN